MKKNSIARKGFLTALSLCLLVFVGCHSHEDSATMKEARALNAETTEVGRKFHDRLDMIREDLEA